MDLTPAERLEANVVRMEAAFQDLAKASELAAEQFRQLAWLIEWSDIDESEFAAI